MVKGCRFLRTGIFTLEITKIIRHNNTVNITGQVEHFTEDISYPAWGMERESGKCYMVILMKVSIWMIRKTGKAFTTGRMDPSTLALSKMITDTVMEKCNGMMVGFIRGNGSMGLKKMSPFNLITALIKWAEIKVLSIQSQLHRDKRRLQCQKDTTFHLFKKSKWDQYRIQAQGILSKLQIHPFL